VIEVRIHPGTGPAQIFAVGLAADADPGAELDAVATQVLPVAARSALLEFLADGAALKAAEVRSLPLPDQRPGRVIALGLGGGSATELRKAGAALARAVDTDKLTLAVTGLAGDSLAALVEGLMLGGHRYSQKTGKNGRSEPAQAGAAVRGPAKSGPAKSGRLAEVSLVGVTDSAALERGRESAESVGWVRDLANAPSSTKTPQWLAQQAFDVLTPVGIDVVIRDEQWLAENGFGGVLAVGGGSSSPPRLVHATWRPRGSGTGPHLVIVGKGITFDTGGLNLKPGGSMRTMNTDMAGGAAALGALRIIAERRVPRRVTVLVPIAENSMSGSAMRPSDVIRHYGGRTSEVGNTDAEGRLVLADALAYAVTRLRPDAIVDIATLTGAMMVALGTRIGGILSNSDELSTALLAAAETVDEPFWRLPLIDDYEGQLHSEVADAQNAPGNPGGITAALFLQHFVGEVPWAHLDIAGPSRLGSDYGYMPKGATGFGARLLAQWVEAR
jgi:leucyl aminopeptidase